MFQPLSMYSFCSVSISRRNDDNLPFRFSVGSAEYNYDLSQRRANSVIQYLATKYNVPAHKIYVIGLGKDKPVETNKTKQGRADNRRVDVRLMTNTVGDTNQPANTPTTSGQSNPSSM